MGATRPRIVVAASDRRVMTARQRHYSADRFTALLFG
jgi:hypothetical protein